MSEKPKGHTGEAKGSGVLQNPSVKSVSAGAKLEHKTGQDEKCTAKTPGGGTRSLSTVASPSSSNVTGAAWKQAQKPKGHTGEAKGSGVLRNPSVKSTIAGAKLEHKAGQDEKYTAKTPGGGTRPLSTLASQSHPTLSLKTAKSTGVIDKPLSFPVKKKKQLELTEGKNEEGAKGVRAETHEDVLERLIKRMELLEAKDNSDELEIWKEKWKLENEKVIFLTDKIKFLEKENENLRKKKEVSAAEKRTTFVLWFSNKKVLCFFNTIEQAFSSMEQEEPNRAPNCVKCYKAVKNCPKCAMSVMLCCFCPVVAEHEDKSMEMEMKLSES